jgi:N-acetyl-anhydromuramoyl-L-alanine amidase
MPSPPSASTALRIDPATGLLLSVRQVLTDHFEPRPGGLVPELIVIHGISLPPNEFGGPWIDRLFTGSLPPEVHPYFAQMAIGRVSAHALIRRDGEIVQYVPFGERAWHSGRSSYQGRAECNDYSVGIELEGADGVPYEAAQYDSLAALIKALLIAYPTLSREHITGHVDVAPGRKSDPWDSFDWARLRSLL